MSVSIRRVSTKKELKSFVNFYTNLYKGNKYYVPNLFMDDMNTLDPKKNPASEFCISELFLAYKDDKLVGRVAAIINTVANKKWNHKEVRFGWLDFIDDKEVSKALLDKVLEFGKENGMDRMVGPLGFTDFDADGMLIEGFDQLSTLALLYNYPYYKDHIEAYGMIKDIDWVEYKIVIPKEIPDKYTRMTGLVEERYGLKIRKFTKREIIKGGWGYKVFDLINETYANLYDFSILNKKQIDQYVDMYLKLLDLKFISAVVDKDDNLIGVGIMMPSIERALQKCRGRIFPFGWWHLLKSMYLKYEENLELLLIGIKPEYQNKGVNALIFNNLMKTAQECGFKYAETNAELENNLKIQALWNALESVQHKRRRTWAKDI